MRGKDDDQTMQLNFFFSHRLRTADPPQKIILRFKVINMKFSFFLNDLIQLKKFFPRFNETIVHIIQKKPNESFHYVAKVTFYNKILTLKM